MRELVIYTDGACSGNPGPMGAGLVLVTKEGKRIERSIPLGHGTNQKAELLAVKAALEEVYGRRTTRVTVRTDSQYAIGCLTKGWKVVANGHLVEEIRPLIKECAAFRMEKVNGHAGHRENEMADRLAVEATRKTPVF